MKLQTLADVRDLVEKHLPTQYRHKPTWRHVSTEITKAAEGEKDLLEIWPLTRRSGKRSTASRTKCVWYRSQDYPLL